MEKYWINPKFTYRPSLDYDFALLKLAANISDKRFPSIRPACLPTPGMEYAGMTAMVSGWGRTDTQVRGSQHMLRSVEVEVMSSRACQEMYAKGGREVTDRMVFAMAPGQMHVVGTVEGL